MIVAARLVVLCLVIALNCGFALVTQQELAKIRSGQSKTTRDVSSLYADKIVPYAKSHAHDMAKVQKALADDSAFDKVCKKYGIQKSQAFPCTFWVSLTGTIKQVDRESRAGKMVIQTADGEKVTVLIGPIIPGTDIRNGYPKISYNDFNNQGDFANLAEALNDEAVKVVKAASDALQPGKRIKVIGAYGTWGGPAAGPTEVTPVALQSPQPGA
ncbi:DUF2291 family protein [Salinisphaera sp.]|uniref:DUF2291 family protein n=1 Tax=Salinisphaera sp. TaxID=1914330 RepID=UPI002D795D63|nr:DUF2291 family protein [Salinisphaera sp.]HET7315498.1 DUF2291 family protein [Salinisphaera sp.]